jgi:hypothetical protein
MKAAIKIIAFFVVSAIAGCDSPSDKSETTTVGDVAQSRTEVGGGASLRRAAVGRVDGQVEELAAAPARDLAAQAAASPAPPRGLDPFQMMGTRDGDSNWPGVHRGRES